MTEASDVVLHVRDLILFPVILLHLVLQKFTAGLLEHVVISCVILEPLLLQMDDALSERFGQFNMFQLKVVLTWTYLVQTPLRKSCECEIRTRMRL